MKASTTAKNLQFEDSINGKNVFFNPQKGRYVNVGRNKANRPQRGGKEIFA